LALEMEGDLFEGVLQRSRTFEAVYQPAYQIGGLFGIPGRQHDRNHYRVYFEYEYSATLFVSLAFSILLLQVVSYTTDSFTEPTAMWHLGAVTFTGYLFGSFVLWKTAYRREFYYDVIKYAFFYLFYAKAYPFAQLFLPTAGLYAATLHRALWYINNLSFQFERLILTTNQGFSEVIALNLLDNMRESIQQDLEDDLRDEI